MQRLQGKTALITGGTTGIGLATARLFIDEGARVAVTGFNPDTLEAARRELGEHALVLRCDAGAPPEQARLAATVRESLGRLDVVFVNAGIGDFRPLEQWDEASFDRSFATNLKGPFFLLQALLPVLADPASVVLNSSINAHLGMPHSSVYAATKAALRSLARTLSGELVGRGIRVNAVSPGPVTTPIYGKLGLPVEQLEQMAEGIRQQVPLQRFGDPKEIAEAVLFLASDASSYMVGSEMLVDGGMVSV
ncbi:SDR family oxidoreductase [Schlegelella sp. S2-27]|uniref:SDR family oxidoreductase n=1 Tax=Caldimonas mangrovi TaxID=2944811 RepID=A0ABT0YVA5_9BURK|nr:SDR family oxidoreductase [Caldimonas mangrovi]MCM5682234.1 SDR family oxidoreductase [Caldimonas mangrovi]